MSNILTNNINPRSGNIINVGGILVGNGSGLYGVIGVGSGIDVANSDSIVGSARTVNFGANLSVSPVVSGIVTVTAAAATTYTDSDVDAHLNQSTATNGEVLSWDGSDYQWVPQAGGGTTYTDSDVDAHLNQSTATNGEVLSWDGSDYQWVPQSGGGGGGSSFFVQNSTGIHTLSNVGIGTTNAAETLSVNGTIGVAFGNVLIGNNNVGSSLQPDTGTYDGVSNIFIGNGPSGAYAAGEDTTTGYGNIFLGPGAGFNNITGNTNIFLGTYTAGGATNASDNVCIGNQAGYYLDGTGATSGRTYNVFLGKRAGFRNTTGNDNNFIGYYAGRNTTTGNYNNFFGHNTGTFNTTGSNNAFIGQEAGYLNTTGNDNIFIGHDAGRSNTSGNNNVFIGNQAGRSNSTGVHNYCIGKDAGRALTSGQYNTFIGLDAGTDNTDGFYNCFIGKKAGENHIGGFANTFIGAYAGQYHQDGFNNAFIGYYAGQNTTDGFYNTFIGFSAGQYNDEGYGNIFIGQFTGQYTTGLNSYQNTMIGAYCGQNNTGGYYNVFLGAFSGGNNTTGYYNTFLGVHAGQTNTTGDHNICIGDRTLSSTTASYKIILGQGFTDAARFDSPDTTSDYQLAVGIRTSTGQSEYWLVGDENFNVGIGVTNPASKLHVGGDITTDGAMLLPDMTVGVATEGANFRYESDFNQLDANGEVISTLGATIVEEQDSGPMVFKSNAGTGQGAFQFFSSTWNPIFKMFNNGKSVIYHGGSERFRTTSNGVRFSGNQVVCGTDADPLDNDAFTVNADITSNNQIAIFDNKRTSGSGTAAISFRSAGTERGNIVWGGGNVSYNTSSDYRIKENVVSMSDSIDKVKLLNPCSFNFIGDSETMGGFIAHEVQDVVDYAVSGVKDAVNEDGSIKAQCIDQSKLVPLLTSALKEAITKIESLEARISALESSS